MDKGLKSIEEMVWLKINFVKVNPTENMTVLVLNQFNREQHMSISKKLMEYGNIYAEQVGFIEKPITQKGKDLGCLRLQMMGGEFCGNASRAFAAFLIYYGYVPILNKKLTVPIEVSGTEDVLYCDVEITENDLTFTTGIGLPEPISIQDKTIAFDSRDVNITVVELSGITHIIVDSKDINDKMQFFKAVRNDLLLDEVQALGIIFYDKEKERIEPLVYVRETDTLVFERGCASGTAALGAAVCFKKKADIKMDVFQPGGKLLIEAKWKEDKVSNIYLKGDVKIAAEGIAYI